MKFTVTNINRKKRQIGDSISGKSGDAAKTNNTITANKPVYGCPKHYERITEYMCVRIARDKKSNKEKALEYSDAEQLCKDDKAKLLYFSDSKEALRIWKWLGKPNDDLPKFDF